MQIKKLLLTMMANEVVLGFGILLTPINHTHHYTVSLFTLSLHAKNINDKVITCIYYKTFIEVASLSF